MDDDIFDPADAANLQQLGALGPINGGKRKASVASILTTSTESSDSSTSASSVDPEFIDVPTSLRSQDSYEFVGLSKPTAAELWQRYCNIPADLTGADGPITFISLATDHIARQYSNAYDEEDDWQAVISQWGVAQELIMSIIAPEFEFPRFTMSARDWVVDSMKLRYGALQEIQEKSRLRLRLKQASRRAGAQYHVKKGGEEPTLRGDGGEESSKEAKGKARAFPVGHAHTLLWRGTATHWLEGIQATDGTWELAKMYSTAPNDFQGSIGGGMLYASPQRVVAEKYANYAKHRSGTSGVRLVWMRVPNEVIQGMKPYDLRVGEEWKTLVWHARNGKAFPKTLNHIYDQHLLIGHICHNPNEAIMKLGSWQDMSEAKHVMNVEEPMFDEATGKTTVHTRKAIQYAFCGYRPCQALEESSKFKIMGVNDPDSVFDELTREEIQAKS